MECSAEVHDIIQRLLRQYEEEVHLRAAATVTAAEIEVEGAGER
jgi:hypothetical protein